ncbi:MAG: DUF721 domain-containing protein [Patescibacteria group bacterium]|nr:DUF721 domain-containing protein [Patescibacteria group bacterium]
MKKISSLLFNALRRAGIEKEVLATLVIEEFKKILVKKFGKKILKQVKILHLKNQILSLSVLSSVIAQEIKLNEEKFLKKINQKFGQKLVKTIRFFS